jgi:hypothetical protein
MIAGPGTRERIERWRQTQSREVAMEEQGEGMRHCGGQSGREEYGQWAKTTAGGKWTAQKKAGAHKERRDTRKAWEHMRRTRSAHQWIERRHEE